MDMPEKIAAWRFHPKKADAWIKGGWSEVHDHKTTEYTRSDLAVEVKPLAEVMQDLLGEAMGVVPESAQAFYDYKRGEFTATRVLSALTARPDDLRPKLQALVAKWEGMTCRTKCAQELREVLEGGK